jgi:hypothetical protein
MIRLLKGSLAGQCYQKTVDDRTVILNVRAPYIHPFVDGEWTDLRVGFFLSLTKAAANDDTTGLAETLPASGSASRYWIGLKSNNAALPGTGGQFIGYSNSQQFRAGNDVGDSRLDSSDIGLGTTNAFYWRPSNVANLSLGFRVLDGATVRGGLGNGSQQHFPQDATGATGYAVLLAMQLLRPSGTSRMLTIKSKAQNYSTDMLYTNTPTKDVLRTSLQTWPSNVQQVGPASLSGIPDALYFYWPFHNSRLRIHSLGLLQAA